MTTNPATQRIVGYHGTNRRVAEAVLNGEPFRRSENSYDWLEDGVYFWQDAPRRAWRWAQERHGGEAAVVGANIRLDGCLDLLDIGWVGVLQDAYVAFAEMQSRLGQPLPKQTELLHRVDRAVINLAVPLLSERDLHVTSIRAAFREGTPIYPDSAFFDLSHVQIAVRDENVIEQIWIDGTRSDSR